MMDELGFITFISASDTLNYQRRVTSLFQSLDRDILSNKKSFTKEELQAWKSLISNFNIFVKEYVDKFTLTREWGAKAAYDETERYQAKLYDWKILFTKRTSKPPSGEASFDKPIGLETRLETLLKQASILAAIGGMIFLVSKFKK